MAVCSIEPRAVNGFEAGEALSFTNVAVMDDHLPLAASLVSTLSAHGHHAQMTNQATALVDALVVTAALSEGDAGDIHWRALTQMQAFRRAGGNSVILLQDTGGRFNAGPSEGWFGGMPSLARTAALEWPDMTVRCIDIAVDADDMSGTCQRLLTAFGPAPAVVGVDLSGQQYSMQAGELISPPRKSFVPTCQNAVWLVSGGARGVTADCVEALAQRCPGRYALLGRSVPAEWPTQIPVTDDIKELRRLLAARARAAGQRPVPMDIEYAAKQALAGQEIRDNLMRLEAAGVTARYYPCDIADQQQVHGVIARIRQELGQVSALVHGAGVLADGLLIDKTRTQFDRVFETKVKGLQNLLAALGDVPLSHIAFFSSAAAFYGNNGQSDYAMANEVLNRVAQSIKRRCPEVRIKSFNWGPWDSGMVDQTLARYFEERGISLIPVKEGADIFANEILAGDHRQVELLVGDTWAG